MVNDKAVEAAWIALKENTGVSNAGMAAATAVEAAYPYIEAEVLAAARKRVEDARYTADRQDLSTKRFNCGIDVALAALGQDTGEEGAS